MGRILIADDHDSLRRGLAQALAEAGHEIEEAPNGNAAIEKLHEGFFDVVVSDLKMGGSTGLDVLKTTKTLHPSSAVILMTAFGSVSTAVETEPKAVIRMTAHVGCSVLVVLSTSSPVLPPIFRSLTTTSKKPSCSFSIAALPFGASSTSCPASAIACASPRRRESWSSAIRMRPISRSSDVGLTK